VRPDETHARRVQPSIVSAACLSRATRCAQALCDRSKRQNRGILAPIHQRQKPYARPGIKRNRILEEHKHAAPRHRRTHIRAPKTRTYVVHLNRVRKSMPAPQPKPIATRIHLALSHSSQPENAAPFTAAILSRDLTINGRNSFKPQKELHKLACPHMRVTASRVCAAAIRICTAAIRRVPLGMSGFQTSMAPKKKRASLS
jgi:hypothetical protein